MTICPSCDTANIDGVDTCERCGQPLSDLYLSDPRTGVERSLLSDRVTVLQPKPPIVVAANTTVGEVLRKLFKASIGCVLVVDDENNIVGIFSERDAVRRLGTQAQQVLERPISEFMTSDPECLVSDSKIAFAVHRMDLGGFRHGPIVDQEGKPIGVISVRDILRYLTEKIAATAAS